MVTSPLPREQHEQWNDSGFAAEVKGGLSTPETFLSHMVGLLLLGLVLNLFSEAYLLSSKASL